MYKALGIFIILIINRENKLSNELDIFLARKIQIIYLFFILRVIYLISSKVIILNN